MLEIIEAVLKGLALLFRLIIEAGHMLDITLSGSGRFLIKAFYPPHWKKKVTYNRAFEYAIGILSWCLFGYLAFNLSTAL